ncbi:hypothetical protein, partial [Jeotgalibaca caeni]|uniref:hypothetical protein n=1 Tax=Jeotgalibaca caeni TaxID=3028623 RepID=UPI00237E4EAC
CIAIPIILLHVIFRHGIERGAFIKFFVVNDTNFNLKPYKKSCINGKMNKMYEVYSFLEA